MSNWKKDPEFLNYLENEDSSFFMRRMIFNVFVIIASTLSVLSTKVIGDWAIVPILIVFGVYIISKLDFNSKLKSHYRNYAGNSRPLKIIVVLLFFLPGFTYAQEFQTTVSVGRYKMKALDTLDADIIPYQEGTLGYKIDFKVYPMDSAQKIAVMYINDAATTTYLLKAPAKQVGDLLVYPVMVSSLSTSGIILLETRFVFVNPKASAGFGIVGSKTQIVFGRMQLQDPKIFN